MKNREKILRTLHTQIDKARLLEKLNQLNTHSINKNQKLAEMNIFFHQTLERDQLDVKELQRIFTSLELAMDRQNQTFTELKELIKKVIRN